MKRIFLLVALLSATLQLRGQEVFAIVTVATGSDSGRFVIELDPANAPRSVAQLMLLADPSDQLFRNSSFATLTNNPAGSYEPSDAVGFATPGGVNTYSISVNGSTRPTSSVPSGTVATVTRSGSDASVATFVRGGSSWIHQRSDFEPYVFSLSYNSNFNRYMLTVEIDLPYLQASNGTLTSGPFYDSGGPIPLTTGTFPFLTIGERVSGVNTAPGWLLPNEIINPAAPSVESDSVFGNHFVNTFGNVSTSQRYAVAFANEDLTSPNTAGSKLLITGFSGNPNFEGRHTYVGEIVFGSYQNNSVTPSTIVPGSRELVDTLLTGSPSVTLTSIDIETRGSSPFLPIDGAPTLPALAITPSQPCLDFSSSNSPLLLADSSRGQVRLVERSFDLRKWFRAGESNFPPNAPFELGFPFQRNGDRQFFRVNPLAVTYSSWPSQLLNLINRQIRFQGLAIDSTSGPQTLNNFIVSFDNTGLAGTLTAAGGDLDGNRTISDVVYSITGPYEGTLSMRVSNLPRTLKLRLYFEATYNGGMIARFHRLVPNSEDISLEEKGEYGVWRTDS